MSIVKCSDIKKNFPIERGYMRTTTGAVKALDGVSISIDAGQSFGLVGESGCGKTTLGKIILGVLGSDGGKVDVGTKKIQAIFQNPFNSLDPKMKIFDILAEGLILSRKRDIRKRIEDILEVIKLPKKSLSKYPHQFSGGERQRIAIGRAVLTEPEFIVCDEPVSSLDVTIQLQILKLLKDIRRRFGMTYLFISHDLRVIKYMCDHVAVMKDGRIVEEGSVEEIYSNPKAEYTKQLLSSILEVYPKAVADV